MYLAPAIDSELLSAMLDVGRAARVPISPFVQYGVGLGLPLDEVFRVATYYRATWYNIQGSIESAERLSPFARADLDASIWANYHVNTISAKWYELSKPTLNPYAVRYVDNVLAQPR